MKSNFSPLLSRKFLKRSSPELPELGEVGGGSCAAGVAAQLHSSQQLLLSQGHVHLVLVEQGFNLREIK
jgi:hypothetical protein